MLGATEVEELGGGHQSRAFRVVLRDGATAVAKVFDATSVDRAELDAPASRRSARWPTSTLGCAGRWRSTVRWSPSPSPTGATATSSASSTRTVVHPIHRTPPTRRGWAPRSRRCTRRCDGCPTTRLPLVATLRGASAETLSIGGADPAPPRRLPRRQPPLGPAGLRIFDLDDCGYGPPAFDVANALVHGAVRLDRRGHARGVRVLRAVVRAGLRSDMRRVGPGRTVLDQFIDRRVDALARLDRGPRPRSDRDPHRVARVARDAPRPSSSTYRSDRVAAGFSPWRRRLAPTSTGSSSERSPSTVTSSVADRQAVRRDPAQVERARSR